MEHDLDERLESVIESSPALGDLAARLRKWVAAPFENNSLRPFKNFLNGEWLEHPLHPVLTDVPIGAWTTAMAFDLATLALGERRLGKASALAIGVGTLGALGALASGLMDWADTEPPEERVALVHGATNAAATLLFATSLWMRQRNRWRTEPSHVVLAGLGYLAVTVGGYLGGSLVFRHGVMVNRNAYRRGPKEFRRALAVSELPENTLKRVNVDDQPVLLLRRGETIYAIGAVCSHYGGPLDQGRVQGDTVECPWHYSTYSLYDGSYQTGPTTAPVPAYEVRINGDAIEVKRRP